MDLLLDNFRDFIARAGFRILLVPNTPKEFVGQYLLYAYLDQFVQLVHGHIYLEGQTGRGKIDLAIFHNARKYIVETKIWEGPRSYQGGKRQLAAYLKLEGASEGYYVVFDHRTEPQPRVETETIDGLIIRSYVIPVVQEAPHNRHKTEEKVMKDKILEEIEAIAKAEGERPIEEVMQRGMDALEKELDPVEISRFIAELRRMKSGVKLKTGCDLVNL